MISQPLAGLETCLWQHPPMLLCLFRSRSELHHEKPSRGRYLPPTLVYVMMVAVAAFQQGQCQAYSEDLQSAGGIGPLLVLLPLSVGLLAAAAQCIPPGSGAFPQGGAAVLSLSSSSAHSRLVADILVHHIFSCSLGSVVIIAASTENTAALLVLLPLSVGLLAAAAQCIPLGSGAFPQGGAAVLPRFSSSAHSRLVADILVHHIFSCSLGSVVIIAASTENTAALLVRLLHSVGLLAAAAQCIPPRDGAFPREGDAVPGLFSGADCLSLGSGCCTV